MDKSETILLFLLIFVISALLFELGKNLIGRRQRFLGKSFIVISFIMNLILIGFRTTGIDHEVYYEWFKNADFWLIKNYYLSPEPLFAGLTLFSKNILNNFQFVYFFAAFVFLLGIYLEMSRRSKNGFIGLFFVQFYIFVYMCGLTRLAIAIGLVSISFRYLKSNEIKKFLLFTLLAFLFHYSAIINIIILLAYKNEKSISMKNIVLICVGMYLLTFVFKNYASILPDFLLRYGYFTEGGFDIAYLSNYIVMVPAVVLFWFFKKSYIQLSTEGEKIENIVNLILIFMVIALNFPGMFRLLFYFAVPIGAIYDDTPRVFVRNNGAVIVPLFVEIYVLVGIYYVINLFNSSYIGGVLIPYELNLLF